MTKPANCSDTAWRLLMSTWEAEPRSRPAFSELASRLERALESALQKDGRPPRDLGAIITELSNKGGTMRRASYQVSTITSTTLVLPPVLP